MKWQPAPVPLPGKSHRQRSLAGYSPWGLKVSGTTEQKAKDNQSETTQKANTISINPESASQVTEQFSWVPLCCCSLASAPFLETPLLCQYIRHFWVSVKKALNYGRCPPDNNSWICKTWTKCPEQLLEGLKSKRSRSVGGGGGGTEVSVYLLLFWYALFLFYFGMLQPMLNVVWNIDMDTGA